MGERIEEERRSRGWSQQRLVDRVRAEGGKLTQSGLDKLEKRSSQMSKASTYIARALGVNHDWLLTGKGPKEPLRSLDAKLELLPADEMEEVYDDLSAIIERRLEKHRVRQ